MRTQAYPRPATVEKIVLAPGFIRLDAVVIVIPAVATGMLIDGAAKA